MVPRIIFFLPKAMKDATARALAFVAQNIFLNFSIPEIIAIHDKKRGILNGERCSLQKVQIA
jgi:hypothetical protein